MKTVGFFEEMKLYENDGPIRDFLVDSVDYDKDRVIEYLKSFKVTGICPRRPIDCITGEEIASGFRVIDDGEYEWCDFLPYHIEKYNIRLPEDFIKKIEADETEPLSSDGYY